MKLPRDLSAELRAVSFLRKGSLVRRSGGWRFGTARIPDAIVARLVASGKAVLDGENISLFAAEATKVTIDTEQPAPIGASSLTLEERRAVNRVRFETGHITGADGAPLDDEAIIFFEGDDGSSEIMIRAMNAEYIAVRLVELWNAAARSDE